MGKGSITAVRDSIVTASDSLHPSVSPARLFNLGLIGISGPCHMYENPFILQLSDFFQSEQN